MVSYSSVQNTGLAAVGKTSIVSFPCVAVNGKRIVNWLPNFNFKFVSDVANEATTVEKRQQILKRDIKQHLVNQPQASTVLLSCLGKVLVLQFN